MKRWHCWNPDTETPSCGRGVDADTPEHAAEAYVEHADDDAAEGCEGIDIIHVRLPGQRPVRVRVVGELVPKYTSEVIDPREES